LIEIVEKFLAVLGDKVTHGNHCLLQTHTRSPDSSPPLAARHVIITLFAALASLTGR